MPKYTSITRNFNEDVGDNMMPLTYAPELLPKLSECFEYNLDPDNGSVLGIKCDYKLVKNRYLMNELKEKRIKKIINLYMNNLVFCYLMDKKHYPSFKKYIDKLKLNDHGVFME